MAIRKIFQKTAQPVTQVHVDNQSVGDGSGYWGLILSKTKNGKAIRIADRFGSKSVFVTLKDVDNMIEALKTLKAEGVAMSVNDVAYDKPTLAQRRKLAA